MKSQSMDVFALRDTIVDEYRRFATSFTKIHAEDIRSQLGAIYGENRFWPEPLIQINPSYKRETSVGALVESGDLHPTCGAVFRTDPTRDQPDGAPLTLYKHQQQAIAFALQGQSYVVTTGTGSGKSLCFFIPIVDAILKEKSAGAPPRTRAIIIYPMNALANSQLDELRKYVRKAPGEPPVTFERYTGQERQEERARIAENPPDILLTNFMMLELLMTRQEDLDRRVMANCEGLRFLVLDELHTYRGRQGADVALLVRRVRERLAPQGMQCIGTSATMASDGTQRAKNEAVARVAGRLFADDITASQIISEVLERVTDPARDRDNVGPDLGKAIDAGIAPNIRDAALRDNALAIWVETTLGVEWVDADAGLRRARPRTLSEAVDELSKASGRARPACEEALKQLLLVSSVPERERVDGVEGTDRSFFAFRLHQFFSGAGHAYTTLDAPGARAVTVEGQQFLPGSDDKRLYPVHFCRDCGHEYHPVRSRIHDGQRVFLARGIDDAAPVNADDEDLTDIADDAADPNVEVYGFLTPDAVDDEFTFADREEDYPDNWIQYNKKGDAKLKSHYKKARPQRCLVDATGRAGRGQPFWFIPGRFRFCLRCGETHTTSARDRNRLASLSAEGRSSATTVLVGSALRWMHGDSSGLEKQKRKLLGFTDNRQDAALQAGHFNDFLFVSLLRAGFLAALQDAEPDGVRSDALGAAQQRALGFFGTATDLRPEWLANPDLLGFQVEEAETALRQMLAYRVWFDQRRGWRFTNPNLEQLGLLRVDYLGVSEVAAKDELFASAPDVLRGAPAAVREAVLRELFTHLRQAMAVRSHVLDNAALEALQSKSHNLLRPPWGFGVDEKPRRARWLMIRQPTKRLTMRDRDLIARGGARSALGRTLKRTALWGGARAIKDLKTAEIDSLIESLLRAAAHYGLVIEEPTPFEGLTGWRLSDACVKFRLGGEPDLEDADTENLFFRAYYENVAGMLRTPGHPLFGFEAREHTAQVEVPRRQIREKRFRFGPDEQKELAEDIKTLRELNEANRFLPVMFCSPTMELGVDIAALNTVYLRNVPPTPANYAQRSGRAGRSGQAALVITYCSALSPHDQYFFREPRRMVHGEVRPPLIDLANRDLVDSHLQATWLSCTETPLSASIADLLVLADRERPLRPEVAQSMSRPSVKAEAARRMRALLELLQGDLTKERAPWFSGPERYADDMVDRVVDRFRGAFGRWRQLFSAAEEQRDAARRVIDNYSAPEKEKKAARTRHAQALDQLSLLQSVANEHASDFYTYRYLATEGFLPGYNFPRLPLMAFIPSSNDRQGKQTYLLRPRFLALSEFGPRSLIYHEGRSYRVTRALLALGNREAVSPDVTLPTQRVRICHACGGGHFNDEDSMCHACGGSLADAEIINNIYRIENVATQPTERITANDEERQRQGFELQTTFEWARREGTPDARKGAASGADGDVVQLRYGPGATITRVNKGLRRRANKTQLGFNIDPVTGYWAKNEDEDGSGSDDPTAKPRQWIVPMVQDRKNALLLWPETPLEMVEQTTLQHALLRGLEAEFQLEPGEVLVEPMPTQGDRKGCLLYEATEGGAGVLNRLVAEPDALARAARRALEIMHFDVEDGLPEHPNQLVDAEGVDCVTACYRCLMSYYNQPDHELLDRRQDAVKATLLGLANAQVVDRGQLSDGQSGRRIAGDAPPTPPSIDGAPPASWQAFAKREALPEADATPLPGMDGEVPLVWRSHYLAVAFSEPPPAVVNALRDKGFELLVVGEGEQAWAKHVETLARMLGRNG